LEFRLHFTESEALNQRRWFTKHRRKQLDTYDEAKAKQREKEIQEAKSKANSKR
jgi:hypothetical protein